ncbi:MAG TPA: DUF3180 domain-containing protein [Candidatus Yaniella excrementigallinarum]|nr:DUF3180 domain-containing protein [Candidatus Yaniella excrementigallinarum]
MSSIRVGWVVVVAVVAAIMGWLGGFWAAESGWATPVLGYSAVITLLAVMAIELVLGIRVLRDRQRPVADRLHPVTATRTLILAQAGTYAAAAIGGWHLGILLHRVPQAGFGSKVVTEASVQVITALLLVVVGFLVEHWCRIPPEDSDANGTNQHSPSSTPGAQPTTRQSDTNNWSSRYNTPEANR